MSLGFHGNYLNWIDFYLNSFAQAVKVSHHISNDFIVNSGIPQSSHSGPLIFILFINYLPYIFDSLVNILLYCDGAKNFFTIHFPSNTLIYSQI